MDRKEASAAQLTATLVRGAEELGLEMDERCLDRLIEYLGLLRTWNDAFNLTAIRDPQDMVSRHLLDSLAIAPYLAADRVLDVGSGAGLPGVPLALMFESRHMTLLDANGKKARFLRQVRRQLNIDNIEVVQSRLEHYQSEPFGQITARAFAPPQRLLPAVAHLLAADGEVLAMIGRAEAPEVDGFTSNGPMPLAVPGVDAPRHIVVYRRWHESSQ